MPRRRTGPPSARSGPRSPYTRLVGGRVSRVEGRSTTRRMGLDFPGLLGLAAGFDKNAVGVDALAQHGLRPSSRSAPSPAEPQPGNPKPRLARLPADRSIVNRMGFNNDGAEVVARAARPRAGRPHGQRAGVPLGINIGKTKVVPEDDARPRLREEHHPARAVRRLPGRQRLLAQHPGPARPAGGRRGSSRCCDAVREPADERRRTATCRCWSRSPPTSADDDVLAVADLAVAIGLDGIVATNTTISRDGLAARPPRSRPPVPGVSPGRRCVSAPPR